ncbi:MAG: PHB depolymerase family esterase [Anaeromyxobacteraceae bacterium]
MTGSLHLASLVGSFLALIALGAGCAAMAGRDAHVPTGFIFETLEDGGRAYRYAVYVPRGYDPGQAWPLVLFLHGQGESGTDGTRMVIQGLGSAIQWDPASWPGIVVFPQKPTENTEWEQHEPAVMAMVARARARYRIDPDRIYLTGLSQGGHGSWVLGARHPELWAAVVSICGYARGTPEYATPGHAPPFTGGPAELAGKLRGVPFWAFHGEVDDVVPPQETRDLVAAVRAAGGQPKMTILPGVNHGAWDPAYRDPELPRWLFAQRKQR